MGFDRAIDSKGHTIADSVEETLQDIAYVLREINDTLNEIKKKMDR